MTRALAKNKTGHYASENRPLGVKLGQHLQDAGCQHLQDSRLMEVDQSAGAGPPLPEIPQCFQA